MACIKSRQRSVPPEGDSTILAYGNSASRQDNIHAAHQSADSVIRRILSDLNIPGHSPSAGIKLGVVCTP